MIFSNSHTPYTYLIGWSNLNIRYYGCRTAIGCHPDEFWKTYFTSSDYVEEFRKQYGEPDIIKIRKRFTDLEYETRVTKCKLWEEKVIDKMDAVRSPQWLNKQNAGKDFNSDNKIVVRDIKNNKNILISKDDPRILSGELVSSNKGIPKKKVKCEYCDGNYSKSTLKQHQERCKMNPDRKETDYLILKNCKFCDRTLDARNMGQHENRCERNPNLIIPTFKCLYCDKKYNDHANIAIHEKSCESNPCRVPKTKCKKISIDGIVYESVVYASKILNINKTTLLSRALSKNNTNVFYL